MNGLSIANEITMSSLDIAELTGKEHRNVMRDIRLMLEELYPDSGGMLKFEHTHTNEQNRQSYPVFKLPKRETLILVSGYSVVMRAKIVDRWQELEAGVKANPVAAMLNDPAAMRGLLLGYTEKVLELEHRVEVLEPKAEFCDAVIASTDTYSVAEVAKMLGNTGQNRLYQWLRSNGLVMRNNNPYQKYVDMGLFIIKISERKNSRDEQVILDHTTRVTGKGLQYITERWNKPAEKAVA